MKTFGNLAWRDCEGLITGTLTVVLAVAVAGCGGSSNGNGEDTRLTAFDFGPDTAMEAAVLFADGIDLFIGLSGETGGVLSLVEAGVESEDMSELFCDPGGIAQLNAQQPYGPGTAATLTLTNCPFGSIGGTLQFSFTGVIEEPTPLIAGEIAVNVGGSVATDDGVEEQRIEGELSFRSFRDPGAQAFEFSGRDSYLFLTEGGGTTKFACFNVAMRPAEGGLVVDRNEVVVVDPQLRLFTAFGRAAPVLVFQGDGLGGGSGVDFFAEVARADGYCGVVGASEGIDPGSTGMTLIPDPDVADGVVLSFPGGSMETTWTAILDD